MMRIVVGTRCLQGAKVLRRGKAAPDLHCRPYNVYNILKYHAGEWVAAIARESGSLIPEPTRKGGDNASQGE